MRGLIDLDELSRRRPRIWDSRFALQVLFSLMLILLSRGVRDWIERLANSETKNRLTCKIASYSDTRYST